MKSIVKCKKKHILAYGFMLSMLIACTDYMLQEGGNGPVARQSKYENENLTASVARQWYQDHYAPVVTTRANPSDFTECMMRPMWSAAKEYNRKRYEVVELPVQTRGAHIIMDSETAGKWNPAEKADYIRNVAKFVILYDRKTKKTRSFIMIFVGSYDYLRNTRSIGKNSYLYREPDFDGKVFFYALNGTLINGWKYMNGKIVSSISPLPEGAGAEPSEKADTRMMVEVCNDVCDVYFTQDCVEDNYFEYDSEFGWGPVISMNCTPVANEICNRECTSYDDGTSDEDSWIQDNPPGGAGNGDQQNTPPGDPNKKPCKSIEDINKVMPLRLEKLGVDMSGIKFKLTTDCMTANLRIGEDNTILVCEKFYEYTIEDQTSMVYHECYHINNDLDWPKFVMDGYIEPLGTPPPDIMNYLRGEYGGDKFSGFNSLDDYILNYVLVTGGLASPQYYQNEINAYRNEILKVKDVTDAYSNQRDYNLWTYEQKYKLAQKDYKQK